MSNWRTQLTKNRKTDDSYQIYENGNLIGWLDIPSIVALEEAKIIRVKHNEKGDYMEIEDF